MSKTELTGDLNALIALYDAYVAAAEVLIGFYNQPRVQDSKTDVAETIERENESLLEKAGKIAARIAAVSAVCSDLKDERARVLVDWAFRCGEGLPETMAILANAASTRESGRPSSAEV